MFLHVKNQLVELLEEEPKTGQHALHYALCAVLLSFLVLAIAVSV